MSEPIKRMCDWAGCLEWGIAAAFGYRKDGVVEKMIVCQEHLDEVMAAADRQRVRVVDSRDK